MPILDAFLCLKIQSRNLKHFKNKYESAIVVFKFRNSSNFPLRWFYFAGSAGGALWRRVSHPRQGDDHAARGRTRGQNKTSN
jgi:hypothetical protein